MSVDRIASRYAASLLELAEKQNQVDAVLGDLKGFKKAVDESREFELMLKSPIITSDKKQAILQQIFSGKVQGSTMDFFNLVVKKKREMFLPEIAETFQDLYNEKNHIAAATLTTAVPATEQIMAEVNKVIKENTNAQKVDLKTKIDPSLIGGFVLRFEDKQYDASIATKLVRMKKEFSKN